MRLTVQMDPGKEERIRKPLLEIDYRTYKTDIITDLSVEVPASFYFDYYEEGAAFEQSGEIIVYVFNALVLLVVAVRMYYWIKMNPPRYVARHWGVSFGMKLLLVICDVWSNIMFTVYFAVTSYWFIMYKMQSNAYLLMPQKNIENSTYDIFFVFLCLIIGTKTLAVFMTILNQTKADIFIMDWEKYESMKLVEIVDTSANANAQQQANPNN